MSRGRFYARLESTEWSLLEGVTTAPPFDGAIITDRYLGPWPPGHPHAGEPHQRLAAAVQKTGRPHIVDPDAARLEHPSSVELQSARDARRPLALALELPWTLEVLRTPAAVRAVVDAAQISQVRAAAFTAPYLEVAGSDDPRVRLNVELLRASRDVANGRPVVAFLQVLHTALVTGGALDAARQLARHADLLVLRARRVTPRAMTEPQMRAMARLVWWLSEEGVRVIVDCAGPAGPPLVAAGADGFSAGGYRFQTVPMALHPAPGGGGGDALVPYVPLSAATASSAGAASALDGAAVAVDDKPAMRLANLQTMLTESRRAAAMGAAGYAELLRGAGSPQALTWADVLRRLAARAA